MPLRTDYTNDILDTSKNTERKYNIKNSNGTIVEENVTFEDVTDYTQEGSRFGASDINAITTRVNQLTASDGLDFRFATDGEGNYGYLKADDSFTPFSSTNLDLLWENTEPTVGITTKTINMDLSKYVGVIVYCNVDTSRKREVWRSYCPVGSSSTIFNSSNMNYKRTFTVNSNSIVINTQTGYNSDKNAVIPTFILGVKKIDLLWTNPTPTADITTLTIPTDMKKYQGIIVEFKNAKSLANTDISAWKPYIEKYESGLIFNLTNYNYKRTVEVNNSNFWISTETYGGASQIIPLNIYGIK